MRGVEYKINSRGPRTKPRNTTYTGMTGREVIIILRTPLSLPIEVSKIFHILKIILYLYTYINAYIHYRIRNQIILK